MKWVWAFLLILALPASAQPTVGPCLQQNTAGCFLAGPLVLGSATGGAQGAGTANAAGYYINGTSIGVGPFLPLAGGTLTGPLTVPGLTVSGTLTFSSGITLTNTSSQLLVNDANGVLGGFFDNSGGANADYLRLVPATAANPGAPVLQAAGTDTNIDVVLTPKGAGLVWANGNFQALTYTNASVTYAPSGTTIPRIPLNIALNPTGTGTGGGNTSYSFVNVGSTSDNASLNDLNMYLANWQGGGTNFDGFRTGYECQMDINVASPNATTYGAGVGCYGGLAEITVNVGGTSTTPFGSSYGANPYAAAVGVTNATFTGTISGGTTLTASSGTGIVAGQYLRFAGVTSGTTIVSGSGLSWVISPSNTSIGPITMVTETPPTFLKNIIGQETDASIDNGATVANFVVHQFVMPSRHAMHGMQTDAILILGSQVGASVGANQGILFGWNGSQWPFGSTSYMMQAGTGVDYTTVPSVAAGGLDLLQAAFTGTGVNGGGFALRTAGPSGLSATAIDGSGGLQIGTGYLSAVSGGITLDTPDYQYVSVATLVNGGSGFANAGDIVDDGFGNLFSVAATGGVVQNTSGLTLIKRGQSQATSPSGTINMTAILRTGPTFGIGLQIIETAWTQHTTMTFGGVAKLATFGTAASVPLHLASAQTTAPALTSCGTGSPAIVGSDSAGTVTLGTSATGCVITFNVAYTNAPHCAVAWHNTPLASQSYSVSPTAITLTQTSTSGDVAEYVCVGQAGG